MVLFDWVSQLLLIRWIAFDLSSLQCVIPLSAHHECFCDGKAFGVLMFTQTQQHAWMCLFIASKQAVWQLVLLSAVLSSFPPVSLRLSLWELEVWVKSENSCIFTRSAWVCKMWHTWSLTRTREETITTARLTQTALHASSCCLRL